MKIIYTRHAIDKLVTRESKKFHINKRHIAHIVKKPVVKTVLRTGVIRAVGKLDKSHSLCIAYKKVEVGVLKVITFFPAEKGRYEN